MRVRRIAKAICGIEDIRNSVPPPSRIYCYGNARWKPRYRASGSISVTNDEFFSVSCPVNLQLRDGPQIHPDLSAKEIFSGRVFAERFFYNDPISWRELSVHGIQTVSTRDGTNLCHRMRSSYIIRRKKNHSPGWISGKPR